MVVLGYGNAYEATHLSQSISQGLLMIHHGFLSNDQSIHRNGVRSLPKAHEAVGGVILSDCKRINVNMSTRTAKAVSAEQSVHLLHQQGYAQLLIPAG